MVVKGMRFVKENRVINIKIKKDGIMKSGEIKMK
jgi:hypothetical protein